MKLKEAEWDTEYINNLPDSSFAFIEKGGGQGNVAESLLKKSKGRTISLKETVNLIKVQKT